MNSQRAKSTSALAEANLLNKKIKLLCKDLLTENAFKDTDLKYEMKNVQEYFSNLCFQFVADGQSVYKRLTVVRNKVKEAQNSINQWRLNFKNVKIAVIIAEKSFTEYYEYEKQSMEDLIKMESNLYEELIIFSERIGLWDKDSGCDINKPSAQMSLKHSGASSSSNIPPEVYEFQNYLMKNGGRTGGWTDFNHQTFLKIRRRYLPPNLRSICPVAVNLRDQFLQEVTSALCLYSNEEALSHEEWYVRLNNLEELSKNAIKEHKNSHKMIPSEEETETQIRSKTKSGKSLNCVQQRAKITAWREAKQRELNKKSEEERRRLEEQKRNEELKRQMRVKELKARIEDYQLRRGISSEIKLEGLKVQEGIVNSSKTKLTDLDKKRISERNEHLIQLQMKRKLARSRELEERQDRINRVNPKFCVQVKRDPSRATGYTELWKHRIQAKKDEKDHPSQMRIMSDRPQKGVPEWRRRISTS